MKNAIPFLKVRLVEINFREASGIERAANRNSNCLCQMRIKEGIPYTICPNCRKKPGTMRVGILRLRRAVVNTCVQSR
jgi:hypothetical protein